MSLNVSKRDSKKVILPTVVNLPDNGLELCNTPFVVLADVNDANYDRNDRTGIALKCDVLTVELEKSNGDVIPAVGIEVEFPFQSDAKGFIIDWRQVTENGDLAVGCYKVKVSYDISGITGFFYHGSYELKKCNDVTVDGTVQMFVVLNDFVRKEGINYKDSGFATTIRFKGKFGYMQPNYNSENIIYNDRVSEKVRNEAVRTYELKTSYLRSCITQRIDAEFLLCANQIYISDNNYNNHEYYNKFSVILDDEQSPTFEYTDESLYAKMVAFFKEKEQVSESKYDGNIKGSDNKILELPKVATGGSVSGNVNLNNEFDIPVIANIDIDIKNNVGNILDLTDLGGNQYEAPNGDLVVDDEDGTTIATFHVTPAITENYTAPSGDITLNGSALTDVLSDGTTNVELVDQDNNQLTPTVTGAGRDKKLEVNIGGGGSVGATLMKTNQTTSYGTGDDGDLQEGRLVDFFTLSSTNPFGNTNRFTDELGGQTYSNDIVIDWSTFKGSIVLGYYRVLSGFQDWDNARTNGLAFSIGSFTSGWRLPNINESMNIVDWGASTFGNRYSYSPFNISASDVWTGNTRLSAISQAVYLPNSTSIPVFTIEKSSSIRNIYCRNFTVTGTTLT